MLKGTVEIGVGSLIHVGSGATLTLGNRTRIGARCKVYCEEAVTFGEEIDISWESQVFDTDFHYMEEIATGKHTCKTAPVVIGSYNWIGNRVNIMKGTQTPDYTVVASNSLLNKDYTSSDAYPLLAGSPARVVKTGLRRLFEGIDL